VATLASLQQVDDHPLYVMHYQAGYDLGVSAVEGVGRTVDADRVGQVPSWACSLFAALGDGGNRVYGRNFDWRFSPALLLYTDPPDGYASVSMVDIEYLGYGRKGAAKLMEMSLEERLGLLGAPHIPFDGMNDQGLCVGMAAVPSGGMGADPDKETIDSLGVIRDMLDYASNVDEAVALLQSYNVDMGAGPPLHYLIADRSGRSILVEYYQGETVLIPNEEPWQQATNFLLASVAGSVEGQCWRYDAIGRALSAAEGAISSQEALDLLASVAVDGTQWSVVYGLSTGEIDVVMDRQYENPHRFQLGLAGEPVQAGEPDPGGATDSAPTGPVPTLDGVLSPGEWDGALVAELAFTSERSGNMDIYLMDAAGGDQQRLTEHPRDDYWPTWSPDGSRLAFASERSGNFDIYCMDVQAALEGAGETALRQLTQGRASDLEPAWSPDGARIAFMSDRDGNWEIYTIDVEGGDVQRLTDHQADDWLPAWSPDGRQIAFVSDRDSNREIYVMEASGDNVRRLTEDGATDTYPAWSPDGKQISFVSNRSGHSELYLISFAGGPDGGADGLRQLTHDGASVWVSAWSPDGSHIAFTSDRDGNREIYVMAVPTEAGGAPEGSPDLLRLTDNHNLDGIPAWRPMPVTPP
jgi:Tol biopolymer transport system component